MGTLQERIVGTFMGKFPERLVGTLQVKILGTFQERFEGTF